MTRMSNVASPRGPLPPKVYWRRRLVAVAVVVGLVLLVGRLFTGGDGSGDTQAVADDRTSAPSQKPTASARPSAPPEKPTPSAKPARAEQDRAARGADTTDQTSESLRGAAGPLAPSAGTCKPSDVAITPDVQDTDAFDDVPLRLGLSSTGDDACTFGFGPDTVALQVTSGDDAIWGSVACRRALEQQSVVVRPGWLTYVTVDWTGRRGTEGCGNGGFARPGYYWAEAAAVGGEPHRSQFELEAPPKPEPTQTPSQDPSTGPSDEPTGDESATPSQGSGSQDGADTQSTQSTAEPTPSEGRR